MILLYVTRDRGEHLKKGETKQKIIEFIFSSPSLFVEEPELREYLKKKHDIREPKNIKRLLKDLSKDNLITKQENRGLENKWGIENILQIQKIFEEYNGILKVLQKNDKIISMLIEEHLIQVYYYDICKFDAIKERCKECLKNPENPYHRCNTNEQEKCYDLNIKNPHYDSETPEIIAYSKELDTAYERLNGAFKEHLMTSPYFFKMCLIKTSQELHNSFAISGYDIISRGFGGVRDALKYFDEIFASCVNTDIINNESDEKAIKYTIDMKRRDFYVIGNRKDEWHP